MYVKILYNTLSCIGFFFTNHFNINDKMYVLISVVEISSSYLNFRRFKS
jgi:hypothetical protein